MISLIHMVIDWHHERNTIKGISDASQVMKLTEEVGELAGNVCRGNCIKDDIGDIIVVLINLAERNGTTIEECLYEAWREIKDRKGSINSCGFIKDGD